LYVVCNEKFPMLKYLLYNSSLLVETAFVVIVAVTAVAALTLKFEI